MTGEVIHFIIELNDCYPGAKSGTDIESGARDDRGIIHFIIELNDCYPGAKSGTDIDSGPGMK